MLAARRQRGAAAGGDGGRQRAHRERAAAGGDRRHPRGAGSCSTIRRSSAFGPNAANPALRAGPARRPGARARRGRPARPVGRAAARRRSSPTRPGWASAGARRPAEVQKVWETVRDARDAAIDGRAGGRGRRGGRCAGYEVDRVARGVISAAGYGAAFVHRTGHSIDHRLHGSGPHLDDYETHDDRQLLPGMGFSVEPGVYLTGRVRGAQRGQHVPDAGAGRRDARVAPAGPRSPEPRRGTGSSRS